MKTSKFDKWARKNNRYSSKLAWNAACESIKKKIIWKNSNFEGNWQHEDIEFLIEEIKEMIEK